MRPEPKAVLLDLFHTLVDVNEAPGRSAASVLMIDPIAWNRAIVEHARHHALGEEPDPFESLRRIAHAVDPSIPEERIARAMEGRGKRFRHALIHVRPAVLEALGAIRGMGLRTAVVSNAGLDEIEAWDESPLAPLIDAALFSCIEKVAKPDVEIYLRAAAALQVDPSSCVFVGDGGSREHEGARSAGMATVLILAMLEESLPEIAAGRERNTDWVVRSYPELVEVLRGMVRTAE
ncbi:MAG: HAD family hydrolase [Candidatus Eisenbacteria bacterium]|nr:HAD family hydrolase [Candidatus Eisenbacteria bacterium]